MHNLCLEDVTINGNDVRLVFDQVIFPTLPKNALAVLGTILDIFNFDSVFIWGSNHLPDDCYVLGHIADTLYYLTVVLEYLKIS